MIQIQWLLVKALGRKSHIWLFDLFLFSFSLLYIRWLFMLEEELVELSLMNPSFDYFVQAQISHVQEVA